MYVCPTTYEDFSKGELSPLSSACYMSNFLRMDYISDIHRVRQYEVWRRWKGTEMKVSDSTIPYLFLLKKLCCTKELFIQLEAAPLKIIMSWKTVNGLVIESQYLPISLVGCKNLFTSTHICPALSTQNDFWVTDRHISLNAARDAINSLGIWGIGG